MLEELIYYVGTRAQNRNIRRLGYVYEAAALQTRHRRCRNVWKSHIQSTHQALLSAASQVDKKGNALLVGSGLIHDLPVAQLLTQFERIILLDVVFTYPTRELIKKWPGRLVGFYHDVTGIIDWVVKYRSLPANKDESIPFKLPEEIASPVWVASVNCLTQLPILPIRWLLQSGIDEMILESLFHSIIKNHLCWLCRWQTPYCLITEVQSQRYNQFNQCIDSTDYRPLLQDFQREAICHSRWNWDLYPPGELTDGQSEIRTVEAWTHH